MPEAQSHRQDKKRPDQQDQQSNRAKRLFLLLALLILFVVVGCNAHPACTQNCQNQPAYFYGIPLPHSSYNQFYGTDENGQPIHNSSNDNNSSGHSSNENEGGSFHGGEEP
jgi:hypothetical protein